MSPEGINYRELEAVHTLIFSYARMIKLKGVLTQELATAMLNEIDEKIVFVLNHWEDE